MHVAAHTFPPQVLTSVRLVPCVASQVAEHTTNKQRMDEFSMVYYNNLLSLPCILLLMWQFGEFGGLMSQPALQNTEFLIVAGLGGIIGFAISFSSLWFLSQVSTVQKWSEKALRCTPCLFRCPSQ